MPARVRVGTIRSKLRRFEKILFWGILGFGVLVLVKWQVLAGYGVITSSMEPTILGNPETGDRLAVFKLGYTLKGPARHELVVFFKEGETLSRPGAFERQGGTVYVKRLAGLPGDTLQIKEGDLYLGTAPQRLDRKPVDTIQSILIPCYRAGFDDDFFDHWDLFAPEGVQPFTIEDSNLICKAGSAADPVTAELVFSVEGGAIRDGYLLEDGREIKGNHPVNDLALHLEFELLQDGGEVFGELHEGSDTFRFVLYAQEAGIGGEVLHYAGQPVVKKLEIPKETFPGLEEGRTYSLSFMNIDNQVILLVDDQLVAKIAYGENTYLYNHAPNNQPLFGAKAAQVMFHDVRIDRDVFYTSDRGQFAVDQPYTVPEGYWFFLGDNSAQSEDSRSFGPVPKEDFVGSPLLIYYPFDRIRFL